MRTDELSKGKSEEYERSRDRPDCSFHRIQILLGQTNKFWTANIGIFLENDEYLRLNAGEYARV